MKAAQTNHLLIQDLPIAVTHFYEYLTTLAYTSDPDYEVLAACLDDLFADSGVPVDVPYDWQVARKQESAPTATTDLSFGNASPVSGTRDTDREDEHPVTQNAIYPFEKAAAADGRAYVLAKPTGDDSPIDGDQSMKRRDTLGSLDFALSGEEVSPTQVTPNTAAISSPIEIASIHQVPKRISKDWLMGGLRLISSSSTEKMRVNSLDINPQDTPSQQPNVGNSTSITTTPSDSVPDDVAKKTRGDVSIAIYIDILNYRSNGFIC